MRVDNWFFFLIHKESHFSHFVPKGKYIGLVQSNLFDGDVGLWRITVVIHWFWTLSLALIVFVNCSHWQKAPILFVISSTLMLCVSGEH